MIKAGKTLRWEAQIARYRVSGQRIKKWYAANDVKPERLIMVLGFASIM
jgi:hypothetical protein